MNTFLDGLGQAFGVLLVVIGGLFHPVPPEATLPVPDIDIVLPEIENTSQKTLTEPTEQEIPNPDLSEPASDLPDYAATSSYDSLIPYIDSQKAHEDLKKALVNIHCTLKSQGPDKPLTASGVMIDPKGIVLTNAHVAQYILLRDFVQKDAINCKVRTGSPASRSYEAKVLYISPEWIEKQKANIFSNNPTGTGQNDYAFLLLEAQNNEDGSNFDYITPETGVGGIDEDDPILIGAYPAGILDPLSINYALVGVTIRTKIKQLLTFGDKQIDVISTGGSYLAQKGSSGGGVMNEEGKLIGLFVTSTQEEDFKERDLRAVTLAHIERSLNDFGDVTIESLLKGNAREISDDFNRVVSPLLAEILLEEIKSR